MENHEDYDGAKLGAVYVADFPNEAPLSIFLRISFAFISSQNVYFS